MRSHEFCDWYLEAVKPAIYGKKGSKNKESTLQVLWHVLRDTLILLHPFIPFVTEEIWQKLPGTEGSVMGAEFPRDVGLDYRDVEAEQHMELISSVITGVRNVRGEMNISPSKTLDVSVNAEAKNICETISQHQNLISTLARLSDFAVGHDIQRPKAAATAVVNGATVYVSLKGIIDVAKEAKRLKKEIEKISRELVSVAKKLDNENFLNKAPADVVKSVMEKQEALSEKQQKLRSNLEKITAVGSG